MCVIGIHKMIVTFEAWKWMAILIPWNKRVDKYPKIRSLLLTVVLWLFFYDSFHCAWVCSKLVLCRGLLQTAGNYSSRVFRYWLQLFLLTATLVSELNSRGSYFTMSLASLFLIVLFSIAIHCCRHSSSPHDG